MSPRAEPLRADFLSVYSEASPGQLEGRHLVVIDVLRATSVIVAALAGGARRILPVQEVEEARALAASFPPGTALLAGERKGLPIAGFDLCNSPPLFTPERVRGRQVVLTTMNGTRALHACRAGRLVTIGAFLNASAVVERILEDGGDCTLVCSGLHGRFTVDDALCAGLILDGLAARRGVETGDLGWAMMRLYRAHRHGLGELLGEHCEGYRYLRSLGFQEDLDYCLQVDRHPVVPAFRDGTVVPER